MEEVAAMLNAGWCLISIERPQDIFYNRIWDSSTL
jgi:hypothetical protein